MEFNNLKKVDSFAPPLVQPQTGFQIMSDLTQFIEEQSQISALQKSFSYGAQVSKPAHQDYVEQFMKANVQTGGVFNLNSNVVTTSQAEQIKVLKQKKGGKRGKKIKIQGNFDV